MKVSSAVIRRIKHAYYKFQVAEYFWLNMLQCNNNDRWKIFLKTELIGLKLNFQIFEILINKYNGRKFFTFGKFYES